MLTPIARRSALAGFAACVVGRVARGAPAVLPEAATLLVAGPPGGRADHWADLIAPALGRALQQGSALARENVGGADGVTGANQFDARAVPDGSAALLVPGTATLAWLCGDARVKFEAGHWIPVWAASASAVLATRGRIAPGQGLQLAVHSVIGPELAALLALELMGARVSPVPISAEGPNPGMRAEVTAVLLRGPTLRAEAEALTSAGWTLAFSLGSTGPDGVSARDPAFPDLPTAQELIGRAHRRAPLGLANALRAVSAAAQLDHALILPQLSPAAIVAWWRRGCDALALAPAVQAEAARTFVRPISPQSAGANTAAIVVDAAVLLELRRWLAEGHQWRPA